MTYLSEKSLDGALESQAGRREETAVTATSSKLVRPSIGFLEILLGQGSALGFH